MQQVRVKEIKSKTGKIKSGARTGEDYELVIIIGEDGSEFTTFDTAIKEVGNGGLLEVEAVIKNNKTNITGWKIVEKGTPPSPTPDPPSGNHPGMTSEMWAEKDRLDRYSKECNTCFMGLMEIMTKGVIAGFSTDEVNREKVVRAIDKALDWAIEHFEQPSEAARAFNVPKPEKESDKAWGELDREPEFKNVGEFLTRVTKELKISRDEICEKLSINSVAEITDFKKAWAKLTQK